MMIARKLLIFTQLRCSFNIVYFPFAGLLRPAKARIAADFVGPIRKTLENRPVQQLSLR